MKYGTVPHLDKKISKVVMGVIPLPQDDHVRAFELLDGYRELGGNIIDNSYSYGPGFSAIMKEYYAARGEDALIRFDKGCHHSAEGRRVKKDCLENDLMGNLQRQGVSYSDFFVLHRDDPSVPAGEIVEWLNEHVAAGRIKAFGGSNWHHSRIEQANEYADKHNLQGFSASSPNLSLAKVNEPMWWEAYTVDREGRHWYESTNFPLFAWSSGGGGYFARVESDDIRRVYNNPDNEGRLRRADELAEKKGVTTPQIALAWTLNQPMNVWALVGPRTIDQVQECMAAADIELSPEELQWLEQGD
jgi:1-deoxyxylulose-5-phosphate synthase